MNLDPQGLYARLEIEPGAEHDAIVVSYRRLARVLHPDVAGTGDAGAFIRLHEAYEVLGDADRRAAYDRLARETVTEVAPLLEPDTYEFDIEPEPQSWLPDLPLAAWLGFAGVIGIAAVLGIMQLVRHVDSSSTLPATVQEAMLPHPAPPPVATLKPAGTATHYVLPSSGPVMVWRFDPSVGHYVTIGKLDPFTPVQALHIQPRDGMLEVALEGGSSGFVDATRLMPGGEAAARRAYCIDTAGAPPANGEVLARHGDGTVRVQIENHTELSSVVKLLSADGQPAASVFLAPHGVAEVDRMPAGRYRPEFAFGELWSRGCGGFAVGMRALQFANTVDFAGSFDLVIPPGLSGGAMPVDIPDATFERP